MKLSISSDKMQDKTDLSLDDIIKSKKAANKKKNAGQKKTGGQGRPAGKNNNNLRGTKGGRVNKQNRRSPMKAVRRPMPLNKKPGVNRPMQAQTRPMQGAQNNSVKISIGNLDYGVTKADISELFSEFGQMKRADIFFDSQGKSLGSGEVIFRHPHSAQKAVQKYNGVLLDGRSMKLSVVGGNTRRNVQGQGFTNRLNFGNQGGRRNFGKQVQNNRQGFNNKSGKAPNNNNKGGQARNNTNRGGPNRRRNQNQNQKKKPQPLSAEKLDAQLDAYLNQANK